MRKAILIVLLAIAWAGTASAGTLLTLTNPAVLPNIWQQTLNNPCVIGDPSCHNPAGFDWTSQSGPAVGGIYDLTSPTYSVLQLQTLLGSSAFKIGIDVNWGTGQNPEILQYFGMDTRSGPGVTWLNQYYYNGPTTFAVQNNGNGYSDALLSGFSLSAFPTTTQVRFQARWSNDTDGMEEFFLISSTAPPVPDAGSSILLLGMGLIGLRAWKRLG